MTKGILFCLLVLVVETAVCGFLFFQKTNLPAPPTPNLSVTDEFTRTDLTAKIAETVSPQDWRDLATVLMANGFFSEATTTFKHASEMSPDSAEFVYDYAFCLSRIGDWEESNRQFYRAIELKHPDTLQAMYFIGRNYLRGEQPEEAKQAFRKAVKLPISKFELAKILYRQNQLDESEELLKEVVNAEHGTVQTFILRSQVALKNGDRIGAISKSLESAGKWIRIRSPFGEERQKLMKAFQTLGYERRYRDAVRFMNGRKHLEARRGYKSLQEAEWNFVTQDAWIQLATFSGRSAEAIKLIKERLKRFGPSTTTYNKLGNVYMKYDEPEKAIEAWLLGADLNSDSTTRDCYRNLASYYSDTIGDEKTSEMYQAKGLIHYGYESLGQDSFQETLPMATMATRFDPTSAEAAFLYGRTELGLANLQEAIVWFKKCLKLDPSHGRAKMYLEAIE